MDIVIFKELTNETYLSELEESAKKYEGLYVDMEDAPQRKFVKDKAYDIQQLIKKVDRKRIDESKSYKAKVELEASKIIDRLQSANAPFTFLIEQHKAERAKILAKEKAEREAEELIIKIEVDHSDALQLNKLYDLEKEEEKRAQEELNEQLRKEGEQRAKEEAQRIAIEHEQQLIDAKAKAEQDKINAESALIAQKEQAKINAEIAEQQRLKDIEDAKQAEAKRQADEKAEIEAAQAKRAADIQHITALSIEAKLDLISECGVSDEIAVKIVNSIRRNKIKNLSMNL